jgi:hypothetical protein
MLKNSDAVFDPGVWLPLVMIVAVVGIAACQGSRPNDDSLGKLRAVLPDSVAGWVAEDEGTTYDTESIYSYIDGHAEVYLAYDMRRCLARRYLGPGTEAGISVDVFEMSTPADAFGVFTHDRDGDPVAIGTDGLFRYGWLSFWKGPFFVSVYAEEDSEASRAAVLQLGGAVAEAIQSAGERPSIVQALPRPGLDQASVRFLHSHQILNSHLWLSDDDVFQLAADTPAALGRYRRDGESAYLLVVDYPDDRRLETARRAFADAFLNGSGEAEPVVRGDDGWFAVDEADSRLFGVLAASSPDAAAALLQDAIEGREHDR